MTSRYSRVSGFNPRLIAWWTKGCRNPTSVTFPTRREATRARQNLYALRKAMRLESHHAILLIERGEVIRRPVVPDATDIDDPHILTIRPVNFDINDALDAAGIETPELDEEDDARIERAPLEPPHPIDYATIMRDDEELNNE